MSWVWEEELYSDRDGKWKKYWHLKHAGPHGEWKYALKITHAVVDRIDDRKYRVGFMRLSRNEGNPNDRTFRSLKAAKAYALAVVALET